jgi:hypothetical protein
MKGECVAAFDRGTASCRTILFDHTVPSQPLDRTTTPPGADLPNDRGSVGRTPGFELLTQRPDGLRACAVPSIPNDDHAPPLHGGRIIATTS